MKGKGVFLKLFAIIALFLIVFIGLIILLQTRYFGTYYTNFKESQFKTAVQAATADFSGISGTDDALRVMLNKFGLAQGCAAALFPVEDKTNPDENLKSMFAGGILSDEFDIMQGNLTKEIAKYLLQSAGSGASLMETAQSGADNMKYLISLQSIQVNGKTYVLVVTSSLQSVDEAMGTLNSISWAAYLTAVLISFILALIIAALVARPLFREIKRAKALDNMRRDFIANASHEMKTPISIISGYAESLLDGILSAEERVEYETAIYDESQKMGRLVRGMLEVAARQNEKDEPNKSEFRLNELLYATITRLDKQIRNKSLLIDTVNVSCVPCLADADMLETVLINLIVNALSHTPENGNITFSLSVQNGKVTFSIENEGELIPDNDLPHIWESFYRADKSHSRDDGRYGLGLFVVKTIIEKHHGNVRVTNTTAGVKFSFEIP